jgi:hypothetical protein
MSDVRPITFEPARDWCAPHLEPFRETWPAGWMLASLGLLSLFVREPEIIRYCGGDPDRGVLGRAAMLPSAVVEFGPLCCRAPRETLEEITEDALAGRRWRGEPST